MIGTLHKFFYMFTLIAFSYTSAFASDVTITATLVYSDQNVIDFAKSKGWTETIQQQNQETGVMEDVANPIGYKTYVSQVVKDHLIRWATEDKESQILKAAVEAAEQQRALLRGAVSNALTVETE